MDNRVKSQTSLTKLKSMRNLMILTSLTTERKKELENFKVSVQVSKVNKTKD